MTETTQNYAPTMRDEATGNTGRLRPGDEILGRYVVESELGQGGMGVVYQCLDKVGGVEVAVKGLPPEVSHNADEMEEVRANYSLVEGLRHPNICGIKTLEKDERGDYYLVMDLARGVNLNRWLRQHPGVTDAEKIAILRQIASALDYAHARKIIHRDVKPENVMVDDAGQVQVLDFGLAAQVRSSLSRTSQAVTSKSGTPGYKAPEQWRGQPQDAAADQYALGALAYKLFAGRLPFDGDDLVILGQAVLNEPVPKIPAVSSTVNAELAKALAKQPEERFTSCGAFIDALEGRTCVTPKRPLGKIVTVAAFLSLLAAGGLFYKHQVDVQEAARVAKVAADEKAGREKAEADAKRLAEEKAAREKAEAEAKRLAEEKAARENAEAEAKRLTDEKTAREKAEAEVKRLAAELALAWDAASEDAQKLKSEAESHLTPSPGEVREFKLIDGVKMKFCWCPPGSFTMGSPTDEAGSFNNEAQHRVTLTKGFWLGQFEVTQAQWKSVMGYNPSYFEGDDNPVEQVSWEDCQEFIVKCNAAVEGVRFALPTEAQWEYACRAGSTGPCAGTGYLDAMGWYDGNSGGKTHPVGQKQPNAWNLYDMHGNVFEWCADWYGAYEGNCTDPIGPASGESRVLRGGGWHYNARSCRSADRYGDGPGNRGLNYGFRLLCSAGPHE